MKKAIAVVVSASCLSWLFVMSAQGTLYVSNLDQTPTGSAAIGSDYRIAQAFDFSGNDTNQYTLDSIELRLNPATGNPNGFEVSLYSTPGGTAPQDYLGSLAGPADPSAGGTYSYAALGITLSGGIGYYVVVSSATPIAQGGYVWSASDSITRNGSWTISNVYLTSSDGTSWDEHVRAEVFQMAIHATLIPEPSVLALAGIGLGCLWLLRRRAIRG